MMTSKGSNMNKLHGIAAGLLFSAGLLMISYNAAFTSSMEGNLRDTVSRFLVAEAEHKIRLEDPANIWVVNQPKCGTGSIIKSIVSALGCEPDDSGRYGSSRETQARIFDCINGKKLFRTHWPSAANFLKAQVTLDMEVAGTKPDRCIVVTAVRDPLLSIPSRFFESNKRSLCDGNQSKEEVLELYKEYLDNNMGAAKQTETTAQVLRDFGVENFFGAMERLGEKGYTFFNQPDENGPWAGCELLFLQIDFEKNNRNLDLGLDHAIEGVVMQQNELRTELCPKATDNYRAMIDYEITDAHIDRFSKTNPEIRDFISYYRSQKSLVAEAEHKIRLEDPAMIWIVNQPKCGTGSIERSIWFALGCQLDDSGRYGSSKEINARVFECMNGKTLFRTHSPSAANFLKAQVTLDMEVAGTKPDRCIVVTAVRDPLLSIPSRFFESNKHSLCDGNQSKEEVLELYKDYLDNNVDAAKQTETTAQVLRDFGVENFFGAMERLGEKGYTFFNQPDENGPWAGCELLFLQIDFEKNNRNLDLGLDHAIEGVVMQQNSLRTESCPKATDNYRAMIDYEITDAHIDRFSNTNPEIRDFISYYRSQRKAN